MELDEFILTFPGLGANGILNAELEPGHGVLNLSQSNIDFGDDFLSIVLAGTAWDAPEVVSIAPTLPEPALGSGLAACLLGLWVVARHRRA